ncbi:hypothetical protein LTR74_007985 [Friedmanniomyces endolithicus]|nr:hypothetical protein LTR74_007985 [Friedmanniomyces endolithicus]
MAALPATDAVLVETKHQPTLSSSPSILHGLPAELRNHIYELVLQEPRDSISFAFISGLNNAPFYRPKVFYFYLPPPIIQVNRITRAETLWLWYSDRELRSTLDGPRRLRVCKEWLAVHASHLPFMERVVLGDSWPYDTSEVWTRYKDDDYDLAANEGLGSWCGT